MPITRTVRDEEPHDSENESHDRTFTSFMYKPRWFALSQTSGDEFTPLCLPEWNAEQALAALQIEKIGLAHTDGNCQGYARLCGPVSYVALNFFLASSQQQTSEPNAT